MTASVSGRLDTDEAANARLAGGLRFEGDCDEFLRRREAHLVIGSVLSDDGRLGAGPVESDEGR